MKRSAVWRSVLAACVALALGGAAVGAQLEPNDGSEQDRWSGQATLHVWGVGVSGSAAPLPGGPVVHIRKSLGDILESLNAAFFVAASARKDRLVVLGDLSFSDVSQSGVVPPGVPARGGLRQTSLSLRGGARVYQGASGSLDLAVGARTWWLRASASSAPIGLNATRNPAFVDPIVAAKGVVRLGEKVSGLAYVDYGFTRASSHETYQVALTLNYEAARNLVLSLGYRELGVDYRKGGAAVDVVMKGPVLGATWRF